MIDYQKFNPVITLSFKGKLLVKSVRFLFLVRKILGFTQWRTPVPLHHEDPLHMTLVEKLYLGYKYYYKALVKAEAGSNLETYFQEQSMKIYLPPDFSHGQSISMSVGGDLIPYEAVNHKNCVHLWDEAGEFFFNNDLVFANLETVADPSKPYSAAPEVMLNDMFFNIDEESFSIFSGNGKYKGYDVLSTANNHTLDQGPASVLATQSFLKSKNVAFTGTASSAETRDDFPILERQGIKVAFLSYTYSLNKETLPPGEPWLCNLINLNEETPDISLVKHQAKIARQRGADFIVAALHMGVAYQAYPSKHIVDNMHLICDETGIDVLIGGHPHNPQPMEMYNSKRSPFPKQHFIVYSLGDFVAYDIYKWCHLPLLLKMQITKGIFRGETITLLTELTVKPFYMHRDKHGHLRLLDFIALTKNNGRELEESTKKEIIELTDFFQRFIITDKQRHLLG